MALTLGEWVARERARQVALGLPERCSDPGALGLLAALVSTAQARSEAAVVLPEPRSA